jgi:DNA-binding SARP family transcriptional activator
VTQAEIVLLGTPQVFINAQPVRFARRKALALIAYLAITRQPHSRDTLAELLFADHEAGQARAALRVILAAINQTPFVGWLIAERDTIALRVDETLSVDALAFDAHIDAGADAAAAALYRGDFMAGFTLRDSPAFDDWQSVETQRLQQRLFTALQRLSDQYRGRGEHEQAAEVLRRWLSIDPLHEPAQYTLISTYADMGQRTAALDQYAHYAALVQAELGIPPQDDLRQLAEQIRSATPNARPPRSGEGSLPPLPPLCIGREGAIADVKARLCQPAARVVIQGWPGIGKTTLSALLAHDQALSACYPDGTLWVSLGSAPNLAAVLGGWGAALGLGGLEGARGIDEISARLTAFLKDRRVLLIIDDVWAAEDAHPLLVGSEGSGLILTTRLNDVARSLATSPDAVYRIPILSTADSLTLLGTLAPDVVATYPDECHDLAVQLEGLPLALQVAGRMLHAEMEMGWGVDDLLRELGEGDRLLLANAPADRAEIATQTTPTIAALLHRSVERLPADAQEKFALLAVFAPKPASFTLEAMQSVWRVPDARPYARLLIDRGLLEPDRAGRFQMHALLVMLARSLFQVM